MTYSRMAFFSRPCGSCEARAKIAAHVHAQQLSRGARLSSRQRAHKWAVALVVSGGGGAAAHRHDVGDHREEVAPPLGGDRT